MEISNDKKPCLVETSQGFSVSYNNKLLYSKYAPQKAIQACIQNLTILPGSIFFCFSPVLNYGFKELIQKLPENCIIIPIEIDKELSDFSRETIISHKELEIQSDLIYRLTESELYDLPVILNKKIYITAEGKEFPVSGTFKRIIPLEMSTGFQFHKDFYDNLTTACTNSLMTFWSNRVTLTKFGRKYSRNYFSNLKILSETCPIDSFISKINKPILVFGAGESFSDGISFIENNKQNYFILCVDTALKPLLKHNIIPDGVFVEEAQFIISRAFLDTKNSNFHLFAGLSSLPQLNQVVDKSRISYFTTLFCNGTFINNSENESFLPCKNNPFGSVGLTAVYYSLLFRANTDVPVYVCGLDFSYSAGVTHTKETLAHNERLLQNNRLSPVQNYNAAFNINAIKIIDKSHNNFYTNQTMLNYSVLFNSCFENTENLYDLGKTGIKLNIPFIENAKSYNTATFNLNITNFSLEQKEAILNYLNTEKENLIKLRNLLTGKEKLPQEDLYSEIKKIAAPREYLYMHFPDGYDFNSSLSFLKRIRTEIDFFLKILDD